jgi:hypothetical protein
MDDQIYVFKIVCDEWPDHPCYIEAGQKWHVQFADAVTAMIGEPDVWPDYGTPPTITITLTKMSKSELYNFPEWEV